MRQTETVLRALLEEVYKQRLPLEEAVEKVCAHPSLREALVLDVTKMFVRDRERNKVLSECRAAGLKLDPATAEATWRYVIVPDPYGIYGF
jgi:hypothetical protein